MTHLGLQSVYYSLLKSKTNLHTKEFYILLTIKEITDTFGYGETEQIETRFYPDIKYTTNIDEPIATWESLIYDSHHSRTAKIPEIHMFNISNLEAAKAYVKRYLISAGVSNRLKWQHLIARHLDALTPILEGLKRGIKDEMGTC